MKHLTPDDLTGYIYRTLDDAQREMIDSHLLNCLTCRANITEQGLRQCQTSNELSAVLNAVIPSPQMNFASIAPLLENRRTGLNLGQRLTAFAPAVLVLTGLILALFGLWHAIGVRAFASSGQPLGAFPTLACFLLMLASVEQSNRSFSIRPRLVITWLVAVILWFGSACIGLLNLIVIRDLAIMAVALLGGGVSEAEPIAMLAVFIGAMLYIGFVIGGAEYHFKHIGHPSSWKLFSTTLLGQLFILILPDMIL